MNRRSLPALAILLLACAGAGAQTNGTAASAADRDPFWPVGYAPPDQSTIAEASTNVASAADGEKPKATLRIDRLSEEQQAAIRRKLRVSGFMRFGPDYVARINDQLVGMGDELPVELEGQHLVFLVRNITKDSVQLEPKR